MAKSPFTASKVAQDLVASAARYGQGITDSVHPKDSILVDTAMSRSGCFQSRRALQVLTGGNLNPPGEFSINW